MTSLQVDPSKLAEFIQKNEEILEHALSIIDSDEWKLSKEEPDISFFLRNEKNSPIAQVKSVTTIEAPLSVVKEILLPVEKINKGGPTERFVLYGPEADDYEAMIFYVTQDIPVPLVNKRDYLIFRRHYTRDGKDIYMHNSIECDEIKAPVPGFIRGNMIFQLFVSEVLDDNKVKFTFIAHCDPCGSIPPVAFNMAVVRQGYAAKGIKDRSEALVKK